jgi:hypothetical protein
VKAAGAMVRLDLRTLVVTVDPNPERAGVEQATRLPSDGPENWKD